MKTFFAALAVLTVLATPSFAQSFDPETGTGNVLRSASAPPAFRNSQFAVRHNGRNAFAAVPGAGSTVASGPNSPASTGGGSVGYNQMLLTY
jgi:hypothetical protein